MIHYIVCEEAGYNSSASYNRIRLICDGLSRNGTKANLHILLIRGGNNKVSRLLNFIQSFFIHIIQLTALLIKVNKDDVVVIYSDIYQYWMIKQFGKRTNLIIERTEYPYYEITEQIRTLDKYIGKKNLENLKYASSLLTCSSYLKSYYKKYVNDIFIVPLVVDIGSYKNIEKKRNRELGEYIAYCGSFNNNKDGLPILINAFKLFHDSYPQFKLVLIGSGSNENVNKFKKTVEDYCLNDYVVFTGRLPHDEVGEWIAGATMLALARPNNRQAEGGIPSKVGEYLACGVPSVITRTGDLPNYLKDGVDCFLCEPDSVEAFASRMKDCYNSDMVEVGKRGKESAKQFSHITQSKRLVDYIVTKYGTKVIN